MYLIRKKVLNKIYKKMLCIEMSESKSKNNELENEMTLDMSYFWYSDDTYSQWIAHNTFVPRHPTHLPGPHTGFPW